jgi:predicted permease
MWHLLGIQDLTTKICILGAAIGSMNAVSILAAQLNLAPRLSVLMPAIGIPISVPILFLIDYLIS